MQEAAILEIQQLRLLMGSDRDPMGRVFAQLADALRRNGELDEALQVARTGVQEDPHFTPGHIVLGWVEQDRGEMDAALAAFNRTLELDPENPFGLYGAGALLDARGDRGGQGLLAQARDLMPEIERTAPRAVVVPLGELPFVSLADLAPDGEEESSGSDVGVPGRTLEDLPFMALADLAPDHAPAEPPPGELPDELDLDRAPAELAPDEAPADLDLGGAELGLTAPAIQETSDEEISEEEADDVSDLPFVSLTELAPDPAPAPEAGAVDELHLNEEVDGLLVDEEDEEDEEDESEADATPVTRTMAEILVGQGLLDRAVQVYRQLLEADPHSPALQSRLAELEAELTGGTETGDDEDTPSAGAYFGQLLSWGEPAERSNRREGQGDDGDARSEPS